MIYPSCGHNSENPKQHQQYLEKNDGFFRSPFNHRSYLSNFRRAPHALKHFLPTRYKFGSYANSEGHEYARRLHNSWFLQRFQSSQRCNFPLCCYQSLKRLLSVIFMCVQYEAVIYSDVN